MTPVQIIAALRKYDELLEATDVEASRWNTAITPLSRKDVLAHCRWMIPEAIRYAATQHESEVAKAMRWLCFIQGCLFTEGIMTIDEMREDNR